MTQRRDIFGVFGLVAISDLLSVTPKMHSLLKDELSTVLV